MSSDLQSKSRIARWTRMLAAASVLLLSAANTVLAREVTVAIGSDITTLDPHLTTDTDSASIRFHIYEGLVHTAGTGLPEPQLATSWEISEDGLTYTFELREGVQFHDGTPFNADAVKINFERLTHPERQSSAQDYMTMLEEVEVLGEYRVALHLKEPFGPFLNHLGVHAGHILAPSAIEAMGAADVGDMAIGTGPFRFVNRVRGESIRLERFDAYWGGNTTDIEAIQYRLVPEAGSRIAMLETGEADLILRVTPEELDRLRQTEGITVHTIQTIRSMYIALNTQDGPFADARVRQAANYAVDKQAIIDFILGGGTEVVHNPIAPGVAGHTPGKAYEYDPGRARELLAEAGQLNPEITLWAPAARFPQGVEVVQAVQQQLQDVGFVVELQVWGDYPAYLDTFNYQMTEQDAVYMGWATSSIDAEVALRQPLHGERAGMFINTGGYANPQVDALIDAARLSSDLEERERLYGEATSMIMEDAPWIFLYYGTVSYGQSADLQGVDYRPAEHVLLLDVRLAD